MSLQVQAFTPQSEGEWDSFCAKSFNGTMLHTRRFLNYHGDRFRDASAVLRQDGRLVGVFPAAASPEDPALLSSHPGATYGGIVRDGWLSGTRMLEALEALGAHYMSLGFRSLSYKAVPFIHQLKPAQDDLYALFRQGARRGRCELSCALDLGDVREYSERRRRGVKKALKSCAFSEDAAHLGDLWEVIAQNLRSRHGAKPVHTAGELALLHGLFPQQIQLRCALVEGKVEAGVLFFNSPRSWHAQYIAASPLAYEVSALDGIFDLAIGQAAAAGARYFDFGTSNEDSGRTLNEGLFRFKSEFGGAGVAHETYELDLSGSGVIG